jgi:hypothetical protein
LARTFASPYLGRKPKARVVTPYNKIKIPNNINKKPNNYKLPINRTLQPIEALRTHGNKSKKEK